MNIHVCRSSPSHARGVIAASQIINQALYLGNNGKNEEAEKLYLQALQMQEKSFGQDSIEAALMRNALGEVQLKLRRLDEAESNLRKAVEIRNRDQFSGLDAAVSRENLAQVLEAKGAFNEAKQVRFTGAPNSLVCGNEECPGQLFSMAQLSVCGGCKCVFYCTKQCQKDDWRLRHKPLCTPNSSRVIQIGSI